MDQIQPNGIAEPPRSFFTGRVDDKGRLKLPVAFQEYLTAIGGTKVFITSFDGSIGRIYPLSEWAQVEAQLREPGEDADDGEDLWFMANAFGGDAEMDGQGRVLMPGELRKKLNLEGEQVHLHHYRGHVRIYTDELYAAKMNRASANVDEKLRRYEKKGLR